MDNSTLLVPVEVSALAVNAYVWANQPFRRWEHNYTQVKSFGSSEPDPTDRGGGFAGNPDDHTGVYVHWTLPDALKHGVQDPVTRRVEFPLVPNRWLVVRFGGTSAGRVSKAYLVESDAPGGAGSAAYVFDPAVIEAWKGSKDPVRQQAGGRLGGSGRQIADVLGQVFDLSGWSEKGIEQLFVKAVAPGNPLFSAFQSHCSQVFSFRDPLDDAEPECAVSYLVAGWYSNHAEDPLQKCQSAKPSGSSPVDAYKRQLAEFSWTVQKAASAGPADGSAVPDGDVPQASLYHGMVLGVKWSRSGVLPTVKDKYKDPAGKGIHVAVGNTSADAFKAMIERQLNDRAKNGDVKAQQLLAKMPNAAGLLEAFQYDMLHILDQPSGWDLLDLRIRQEWFGSKPGGYRWTVVDAKSDRPDNLGERPPEQWLTALNGTQAALDEKLNELKAARRRLYDTWWKRGKYESYPVFARPDGLTEDQFAKALSAENDPSYDPSKPEGPDNIASLPRKIMDLIGEAGSLIGQGVPRPAEGEGQTPEEALAAGIEAFERAKRAQGELNADRSLKPVAGPRYWRANDPVVFISGAGSTGRISGPDSSLSCRLSAQIVGGITIGTDSVTADELAAALPKLPLSLPELASALQGDYIPPDTALQLAGAVGLLLAEFFLLDPDNAPVISAGHPGITREIIAGHDPARFQGILPAFVPGDWQQPWNPLLLKWVADWYPIGHSNWTFDGTDYRYDGKASGSNDRQIGGDILLTPQTSFLFRDRLKKLVHTRQGEAEDTDEGLLDQLDGLIEDIDGWDFISQSLGGFGSQLAVRDTRVNRSPDPGLTFTFKDGGQKTLADLVGDEYHDLPYIRSTGDTLEFQGVRQGQFAFAYLAVYDAFGQVLEVIGDSGLSRSDVFEPILSEGLAPDAPIEAQNAQRFIQLPPRPNQHIRLDFRLIDARDAGRFADLDSLANPVAGWLLPNHLNGSVSVYDAQGGAVGDVGLITGKDGVKRVHLLYAPLGTYGNLADIEKRAPELAKMLQSLTAADEVAFSRFLEAIDASLWTIDPLAASSDRNVSVLAGRPLALVRANLKLALDGPAARYTGWAATFNPPPSDFTGNDYEVRLGDTEIRKDGLIGYFLNGAYDRFNSVHPLAAGEEAAGYVRPIGPGNFFSLRFDGARQAEVMLLLDPRAAVHAVTGIVPVQALELPARFTDPVLSALNLQFRTGPILTVLQPAPDKTAGGENGPSGVITLPVPSDNGGQWKWLEPQSREDGPSAFLTYTLTEIGQQARLNSRSLSLREGTLQFRSGFAQGTGTGPSEPGKRDTSESESEG
ncbi:MULTISPECIES: hypothetical protein [unclassified Paenibacillus]|uniref:hypothetical protein n=1 Tax=unclassified Paenibacillus TaxID=185978 RepID=UPI00020D6B88|nr:MULTISPECIES: hypothetical protein [unclassified Paenibacillus]EGL18271.1 hypothetical protein HMPREF9413_4921 [Paenibacillus sp. HGF7]EPD90367.1 hypothetical protein HMPREF1207_01153 [Paenibacillus sp. HGH0039]